MHLTVSQEWEFSILQLANENKFTFKSFIVLYSGDENFEKLQEYLKIFLKKKRKENGPGVPKKMSRFPPTFKLFLQT